jgi:NADH-quinone oxidoreductase subunit N
MDSLESIRMSVALLAPDLILASGIVLLIIAGLIWRSRVVFHSLALGVIALTFILDLTRWSAGSSAVMLFNGSIKVDDFAVFLNLIISLGGMFTVVMTWFSTQHQQRLSEYYALILSVLFGAHLLVLSESLLMVFIALELISICSYVLTAFAFDKKATEGSLKYFVFGSVASAVMVYGFSLLYGMTGTLTFTSIEFLQGLTDHTTPLFLVATTFSMGGFLYKIAAVPMHPWVPDVYESTPMPVVAFFSVVPKLAGFGVLAKFLTILNMRGQPDWQLIIGVITILTLTVGNFSALWQKNVKRLMAYSSIAQSGFLLVAVISFSANGYQYFLFYASVYLLLVFLVFLYLQEFENLGVSTIASYAGLGRTFFWPSFFLLAGLIGLTGLPPTAGFTAKLFIFSALWDAFAATDKPLLLWVLVFGLLNTVVALFYYLRIPYFAFVRSSDELPPQNNFTKTNLLGAILVFLILLLFFKPGLLMGWINKITFVL